MTDNNTPFVLWSQRLEEIVWQNKDPREGARQHILGLTQEDVASQFDNIRSYISTKFTCLEEIAQQFSDDKEILSLIIAKFPVEYCHDAVLLGFVSSPRLLDDEEFVLKMIDHESLNFQFASPRLRGKPELILRALSKGSFVLFQCISNDSLRSNKEFMMRVVAVNSACLQFSHDTIKDDEEIVSRAILNDETSIYGASPRLQQSCDMIMRFELRRGYCPAPFSDMVYFRLGYYACLPPQDVLPELLNQELMPAKLFPFFFEQADWRTGPLFSDCSMFRNRNATIIYYMLQNRNEDLIPSSYNRIVNVSDNKNDDDDDLAAPSSSDRKKRKLN